MAAPKESDASRYLRSTISNIAFLGAIGYFVHEKALSETSLVTVLTLFIGGYFGVRAYQHRAEVDIAASQSNPRLPIPRYNIPPDDKDPPEAPDVSGNPTRRMQAEPIPRTDEFPTNPGGRGRYKRWTTQFGRLIHSGYAPAAIVFAACALWILLYAAFGMVDTALGLKSAFAR